MTDNTRVSAPLMSGHQIRTPLPQGPLLYAVDPATNTLLYVTVANNPPPLSLSLSLSLSPSLSLFLSRSLFSPFLFPPLSIYFFTFLTSCIVSRHPLLFPSPSSFSLYPSPSLRRLPFSHFLSSFLFSLYESPYSSHA